jgi:archaellum component FlaC
MSELEVAVAQLNAEVENCAAWALKIDELISTAGGGSAAVEEQVERMESAMEQLADAENVLGALDDDAEGAPEFLFPEETTRELDELESNIEELEQAFVASEARLKEIAQNADSFAQQQQDRAEMLGNHLSDGREKLEEAFTALTELVTTAHEERLASAREAIGKTVASLTEAIQKHFQERPEEIIDSAGEALQEKLNTLQKSLEAAVIALAEQAEEALSQLEQHASNGVRRAVEDEVAELLESAVEALAREAVESVAFSQISVAATSALSPILPQLIAIRVIVNAIKHALEVMRLGL